MFNWIKRHFFPLKHIFQNESEPGHEKMFLMSYANNKGADQIALNLISAFIVRCLDNVSLVSVTKISSLMLASVTAQVGLCLAWSETPEDIFCHDEAHLHFLAE